jgi:hypothetical protein
VDHLQGKVRVFEEREAAQLRDQARRNLHNVKAKERADENFAAARKRAARLVVRAKPAPIVADRKTFDAGSGEKSSACVVRGELERNLAEFAQWHGAELARITARVSQLDAAEVTRNARTGEIVTAAFRTCRDYAQEIE